MSDCKRRWTGMTGGKDCPAEEVTDGWEETVAAQAAEIDRLREDALWAAAHIQKLEARISMFEASRGKKS